MSIGLFITSSTSILFAYLLNIESQSRSLGSDCDGFCDISSFFPIQYNSTFGFVSNVRLLLLVLGYVFVAFAVIVLIINSVRFVAYSGEGGRSKKQNNTLASTIISLLLVIITVVFVQILIIFFE